MIVTFYSFKGGVGRSMAMAACAYLLAQRGLRTLAIDFDLEAPGLERYFFDDPGVLENVRSRPGLIDLVLAYKRALTNKAEFDRAEFKQWTDFVEEAIPATAKGGSVDLMMAGCRAPESRYAEYALNVRSFDWQDFFLNWRGDRFFDWLRRELTAPGKGYDVVLVDSRTGVTEMGGVCAYQLADVAVLLCAANYQNLDGTRSILNDFRSDAVSVVRQGRPIELLVIPARVEDDNEAVAAQRSQFFDDFERTFGVDGLPRVLADAGLTYRSLALKYQPELAIIERLVDSETLARGSFERLTDALTLLASGGRWDDPQLKADAAARLSGHAVESPVTVADVTKRGAGYDVLFDYRQEGGEAARDLRDRLLARGLSVWTVADATGGEQVFEQRTHALEYSAAVAIGVDGREPTRDHWELLRESQIRRKRIVPVLLPDADREALSRYGLADYTPVDFRGGPDDAQAFERLLMELGGSAQGHAAPPVQAVRSDVSPYPGAAAFSEDQSGFFFGRSTECDALLQAFTASPVVLLGGPPGVGKTSLVRAGLLPRVRDAAAPFARQTDGGSWLVEELDAAEPGFEAEVERCATTHQSSSVLHVIDNVDTCAEVGQAQRWQARVEAIGRLVDAAGPRARVLLVWRGVFPLAEREAARARWSRRAAVAPLEVLPLDPAALREIIEKPAARAGHLLEPGLADRLLADSGAMSSAVAQVQRALAELWAGRRRGWLTNRAYDALGGLSGSYVARAEAFVQASQGTFGGAAIEFLRNLVQFDATLHVASQPRAWQSLATIPALRAIDVVALRDRLLEARLIDLWWNPRGALLCSLCSPTPPHFVKSSFGDDGAGFMLWRQRLRAYVEDFVSTQRSEASLLSGDILGEAERWLGTHATHLTEDESALIHASMAQRDALEQRALDEADAEARRAEAGARRRRRLVWTAMVAALVVLGSGFFWANAERRRAESEKAEAMREVSSLDQRVQALQGELTDLASDRDAVRARLASATSSEDRAQLQQQLNELNLRYTQTQGQIESTQQNLATVQNYALASQNSIASLTAQLNAARGQITAVQTERDTLKNQVDVQAKRADTAEARVADLQNQPKAPERRYLPAGGGNVLIQSIHVPQRSTVRLPLFDGPLGLHCGDVRSSGTEVSIVTFPGGYREQGAAPRENPLKQGVLKEEGRLGFEIGPQKFAAVLTDVDTVGRQYCLIDIVIEQ